MKSEKKLREIHHCGMLTSDKFLKAYYILQQWDAVISKLDELPVSKFSWMLCGWYWWFDLARETLSCHIRSICVFNVVQLMSTPTFRASTHHSCCRFDSSACATSFGESPSESWRTPKFVYFPRSVIVSHILNGPFFSLISYFHLLSSTFLFFYFAFDICQTVMVWFSFFYSNLISNNLLHMSKMSFTTIACWVLS